MIIFDLPQTNLILLDSFQGMNQLHQKLQNFLHSRQQEILIATSPTKVVLPYPYNQQLSGIRVVQSEGSIQLRIELHRWLRLEGSPENLKIYIDHFKFSEDEEESHHHPEYVSKQEYILPTALSLIITVDTKWVTEILA